MMLLLAIWDGLTAVPGGRAWHGAGCDALARCGLDRYADAFVSGAVTAMLAYSFDLIELYKRVANNIDAILRGVKPGNIPIYPVTKFELSINLKTAKQLGLSVPPRSSRVPIK